MRKVYPLLSNKEIESENMLDYGSSFSITEANREMFLHK